MHPLDGIRAKLVRAQEQIEALEAAQRVFFEQHPYEVATAELNSKTGNESLRVRWDDPEIPLTWSVAVGEVAHNLRSALDQLACQLALLNHASCADPNAFPISRYGPRGKRKGQRGRHYWNIGSIRGLRRHHRAMVKRLQPYHRGNGRGHSPLWLLQEIHNADKHRNIQALASYSAGMGFGVQRRGLGGAHIEFLGINVPKGNLKNGTKIGEASPNNVNVHINFRAQIAFSEGCDAVKHLPMVPTLKGMADEVSRIVELFSGEF